MVTINATHRRRSRDRSGIGLAASIVAIAMAAVISGPVAAIPLKQDLPTDTAVVFQPSPSDGASTYGAKLRTTAGHRILVSG